MNYLCSLSPGFTEPPTLARIFSCVPDLSSLESFSSSFLLSFLPHSFPPSSLFIRQAQACARWWGGREAAQKWHYALSSQQVKDGILKWGKAGRKSRKGNPESDSPSLLRQFSPSEAMVEAPEGAAPSSFSIPHPSLCGWDLREDPPLLDGKRGGPQLTISC